MDLGLLALENPCQNGFWHGFWTVASRKGLPVLPLNYRLYTEMPVSYAAFL